MCAFTMAGTLADTRDKVHITKHQDRTLPPFVPTIGLACLLQWCLTQNCFLVTCLCAAVWKQDGRSDAKGAASSEARDVSTPVECGADPFDSQFRCLSLRNKTKQ